MKDKIESRLAELREEFATGQRLLAELDEKREKLRESMLRIAGAIQVLEEMAEEGQGGETGESHVRTGDQP
jgi:prefoldin subunit 5